MEKNKLLIIKTPLRYHPIPWILNIWSYPKGTKDSYIFLICTMMKSVLIINLKNFQVFLSENISVLLVVWSNF